MSSSMDKEPEDDDLVEQLRNGCTPAGTIRYGGVETDAAIRDEAEHLMEQAADEIERLSEKLAVAQDGLHHALIQVTFESSSLEEMENRYEHLKGWWGDCECPGCMKRRKSDGQGATAG